MANTKEIRSKIGSVKNTQKITSAMEMVATSKMKKAQELMKKGRPYIEVVRDIIEHLSIASVEYKHPLLEKREVKNVAYIVISSDRGLCGGLNVNLFKKCLSHMVEHKKRGASVSLSTVGNTAGHFFKEKFPILAHVSGLGDAPNLLDIIGLMKVNIDAFKHKKIDELHLVYNQFVNTMKQNPTVETVLPLLMHTDSSKKKHIWDYMYEPDEPKKILDKLLIRYLEAIIFQGVVENGSSEQAARMVAMKAATDNAGALIDDLQLVYNKVRQAAITQELSEICAGAAAV